MLDFFKQTSKLESKHSRQENGIEEEKLKEELIKLVPLVQIENKATNNWNKSMFKAWYTPLTVFATNYGGKAVFKYETPNDYFSDIKYIGVEDIMVEVN